MAFLGKLSHFLQPGPSKHGRDLETRIAIGEKKTKLYLEELTIDARGKRPFSESSPPHQQDTRQADPLLHYGHRHTQINGTKKWTDTRRTVTVQLRTHLDTKVKFETVERGKQHNGRLRKDLISNFVVFCNFSDKYQSRD